ncbi:YfeC-like transcriptional regulator [Shigella flexneri]
MPRNKPSIVRIGEQNWTTSKGAGAKGGGARLISIDSSSSARSARISPACAKCLKFMAGVEGTLAEYNHVVVGPRLSPDD